MNKISSICALFVVLIRCWYCCWGQTEIFVPQIVVGDTVSYSYVTRLHLVNLTAVPVSGTIEARLDDAASWPVFGVGEGNGFVNTKSFNLPALGESTVSMSSSEQLRVGWVKILSSGPVAAVATLTAYSSGTDPEPITSTSIIPDQLTSAFSAYARISEKISTGFAILNPSLTSQAEVTFRLFDQMGTAGNVREVILQPGNKIARFLKEEPFFPNVSSFEGTMEVSSSQPLSATVILVEGTYWNSFGVFPSRVTSKNNGYDVLPNVIGIDFSAFPNDPASYEGTEISVSLVGDDNTGDGSAGNPYRSIAHALSLSISDQIITVRRGHLHGRA